MAEIKWVTKAQMLGKNRINCKNYMKKDIHVYQYSVNVVETQ